MTYSEDFWNQKYDAGDLGWDIGYPATPLKTYFDQLRHKDCKVLIPGCGNAYEAQYLLLNGFTNVHLLDISPHPIADLKAAFYPTYQDRIHLYLQDFFDHQGQYDLIIEQTFFCALDPTYREAYVQHMYELLKPGARLVGLLFTFPFTENGPPFGGSIEEYRQRFAPLFHIHTLAPCYNSIPPRQGNECFFNLEKPQEAKS